PSAVTELHLFLARCGRSQTCLRRCVPSSARREADLLSWDVSVQLTFCRRFDFCTIFQTPARGTTFSPVPAGPARGEHVMKAVVFHGTGDVRLDDVPEPKIDDPNDAIVRVTASAIFGTDLHIVRGTMTGLMPGTIFGDEGA